MWTEPTLLFRQQVPGLAVGTESRSDDLEKDLIRVCHEGNAAIVTALYVFRFLIAELFHQDESYIGSGYEYYIRYDLLRIETGRERSLLFITY